MHSVCRAGLAGGVGTTVRTGEIPIDRGELRRRRRPLLSVWPETGDRQGRIAVRSLTLDDPGLDIEARRKIETVTVGLNVRGTLQGPRLSFFSDPTMPQTQIVTYLADRRGVDVEFGQRPPPTMTSAHARHA